MVEQFQKMNTTWKFHKSGGKCFKYNGKLPNKWRKNSNKLANNSSKLMAESLKNSDFFFEM